MKQFNFLHHPVRLLLWLLLWLLLLAGPLAARAQAPAWQQALSGNNNQPDSGTSTAFATATDAVGNVFITGNFVGKVAFGNTLLTSIGQGSVFIAKWNTSTSSWAWAEQGGGTGNAQIFGIAVSGTSVYVTGSSYNDSADGNQVRFGGVTVPGTNAAATYDAIVVKYTDNGTSATAVWGQAGGGANEDQGNGIAVSGNSVYVTGYDRGTSSTNATFGSVSLPGSSSGLNYNAFVAKYTDNGATGTVTWATGGGGNADDYGQGIAVNGSSVYATGSFINDVGNTNVVQFGGIPLPGRSIITRDAYVVKYTDGGASVTGTWAQSAGGSAYDYGSGIAVSGTSIYVAGQMDNDAANSRGVLFGSTPLAGVGTTHNYEAFLAKYTDAGASAAVTGVQRSGGTGDDNASAVAVSGTSVYLTGFVYNTRTNANAVQVAGITLGGTGTTANRDLFVAKYTDNGGSASGVWAKSSRGASDEYGLGLAVSGATVCVAAVTTASIATFLTPTPLVQVPANAAVLGLLQTSNGAWTNAQAPLQGGTSTTKATTTDAAGNVYVTGSFTGQVAFGNTTLMSTGQADAFVAKWNSTTSTWAWAERGGDVNDDQGNAIAVSGTSVYVTGYFNGTSTNLVSFGSGVVVGSGSTINPNAFVVKYTDSGTSAAVDWLVSGGGTGPDQGTGLAVSGSSVYVTGSYNNGSGNSNNVSFGGVALPGTGSVLNYDVFLAKYTDGGASATLGWVQHGGGFGDDYGFGLAAAGANVYVTGGFENTTSNGFNVYFGPLVLAGTGNGGQSDAFLVRYTDAGAAGTATWAEHGGGISTDAGQSVAVSGGNVYVTGYFVNSSTNSTNAQFGGVPLLGTGAGTNVEMFVAKYLDNGTAVFNWAQHGGGTGDDYGTGIVVNNTKVYVAGTYTNTSANANGVLFGSTALPGSGASANADVFVAKYTDGGTTVVPAWATGGGGAGPDAAGGIAFSGANVYVAGTVTPTAAFSSFTLANPTGGSAINFLGKLVDALLVPTLTSISPNTGPVGTVVTLTGSNLTGTTTITFGGAANNTVTAGFVVNAAGTQITGIIVPPGVITGLVNVTTAVGLSNGVTYTVTVPPTLTSLSPNIGNVGSNVTLTGTNFTGATGISFNGTACLSFTVTSATSASAVVPVGTTTGNVTLTTPGGPSNGVLFTVPMVPTLTSLSPNSGGVGFNVILNGTNLTGATTVFFSGTPITGFVVNAAGTQITGITVPVGAVSGNVVVITPIGLSNPLVFKVIPTPDIVSFTPASGLVGTVVTLTGTDFTGATDISFNGTSALTFNVVSATSATATVPAGASTGIISITTPGGTGFSVTAFTVTVPVPVLTSLLPTSGNVGASITLTGTNFTGATGVSFNGTSVLTFNVVSATSATATVPVGATTGNVTITTPGGTSNGLLFTVIPPSPTITSFTPASGPIGTVVTLTGTNFTGATGVSFNGTSALTFNVVSATSATATVPAGTSTGTVSLTTPGGTGFSASVFTVTVPAPVLTSLSPNTGPVGTVVTLTGTGFTGVLSVTLNGVSVSFTTLSTTSVTVTVPNNATLTGNVTMFTNHGTSNALPFVFIPAPTITSFTPASGPVGTVVTLTGTNFTGTTNISFNGTPASVFNVVNATSATATVPVGASTGQISITTPNGAAASSTNFFVTPPAPTLTSLSPTSGSVGASITLTGTHFIGATGVSFNGTSALAFSATSATTATATVPAGATTGNVTLTTPGGTSNGLLFTVTVPVFPDLVISTPGQTVGAGTYNSITITGTGAATLVGAVVVNAFVLVQNGGILSTNCQPLTGAASFTLAAGGELIICDPTGLSASGATGAVRTTGLRSFSTDASYTYVGSVAQATGPGLPAQVRNLTVSNPTSLALTQPLAVRQLLRLTPGSGNFALGGQALVLLSDASGTALIANEGAGLVSGGTGTMQRYLDATGNLGSRGYRHYSAPVSGSTVADLQTTATGGAFIPQVNPAYNASATPLALPLAQFPTVFGYDETRLATASNNLGAFDKGWVSPAAPGTPLALGRGYTVQIGNAEKVDFTGTFFSGPLSVGGSRGPDASAGWLLLGNPYPAPLDWGTVGAANTGGSGLVNMDAAAYVFQSTGAYTGVYHAFVNGMGAGTNLMAAGQGFFVRASTVGAPGSVHLTNANRVTTYGGSAQPAFQRGAADLRPTLRLSLTQGTQPATPATAQDEAFVYFQAGATAGFDGAMDAHKLANPGGYSLATASPAATAPNGLSVDGQPLLTAANPSKVLPLLLAVPAGTYTLTATALAHFAGLAGGTSVVLRDGLTGARTDLGQHASYTFAVAAGAAPAGRFALLFGPAGAPLASAPAQLLVAVQARVFPNPVASGAPSVKLEVSGLPAAVATVQAMLLDALGRVLHQQTLPAGHGAAATALPTAGLASGVYLLRLVARDAQGGLLGPLPGQRLSVQ